MVCFGIHRAKSTFMSNSEGVMSSYYKKALISLIVFVFATSCAQPPTQEVAPTFTPIPISATNTIEASSTPEPSEDITPIDFPLNALTKQNAKSVEKLFEWQIANADSIAFSLDGQYFFSGLTTGEIKQWRISDGALLRTFTGHTKTVTCLSFSPINQIMASSSDDKTIRVWDLETGEQIMLLEGHTAKVSKVAFSPDGTLLASGSGDNTIRIWNVDDGSLTTTLDGHTALITNISFSPDGTVLASGSTDKTTRIWDVSNSNLLYALDYTGKSGTSAVSPYPLFTPDGSMLAIRSLFFGSLDLYNSSDFTLITKIPSVGGHGNQFVFSPDGELAITGGDGYVDFKIVDLVTGEFLLKIKQQNPAKNIVISPDSKLIVILDKNQIVHVMGIR